MAVVRHRNPISPELIIGAVIVGVVVLSFGWQAHPATTAQRSTFQVRPLWCGVAAYRADYGSMAQQQNQILLPNMPFQMASI
jgi:hypothetical protein